MESSGPAHEDLNDLSMPSIFHVFATAALALVAGAAAINLAAAQNAPVINVYNWSDYIEPKVIEAFTKETGIKVQYDTFDANETLETKLLAGKSGYDVVVPTGYFLERQIKAGAFQKLGKNKLRIRNVRQKSRAVSRLTIGNQYAINYMWGTTGIGFNAKSVRDRLGPVGKTTVGTSSLPDNLAKFETAASTCWIRR
jgi:putrescine transport system substrate-binding protein